MQLSVAVSYQWSWCNAVKETEEVCEKTSFLERHSEMLNGEYLIAFIRNQCRHCAIEELKLPRFFLKIFTLSLQFYQPITVFVPAKGNHT